MGDRRTDSCQNIAKLAVLMIHDVSDNPKKQFDLSILCS